MPRTPDCRNASDKEAKRIVFLLLPPVRELDVVGPVDVFATANRLSGRQLYEVVVLGTERELTVVGMSGLSLVCTDNLGSFSGSMDTLLIPGGQGCETGEPPVSAIEWVKRAAQGARRVGSICTGAFLLAKAGLLDGKKATTHWAFASQLERRFPQVQVTPDPIWIQEGRIYTSAGVTAGIDLSLAMIEEDHGARLALEVARNLVVFLRRPGSQAQFSSTLELQIGESNPFHELLVWIVENLGSDLGIEKLAERVSMSPRNFHRVFVATTGQSPARFVEAVRVEAARRQLESSDRTMEDIADRCGFGTANSMRRSFMRHLEATPGEYRRNFRT